MSIDFSASRQSYEKDELIEANVSTHAIPTPRKMGSGRCRRAGWRSLCV